jgi:AraC-like DNA-binding protein
MQSNAFGRMFHPVIRFGPYSILLLVGTLHGLALSALLLRARTNTTANRLLALLVALVALRVVPYIIGFAGFFDRWPWLSFLPYEWSLAYGPLLWLYVTQQCTGSLPTRWWRHLLPSAVQGAYYVVMFLQPLAVKNSWDSAAHEPVIAPIERALTLAGLALYLGAAWRTVAAYQRWLDATLSNREEFRLRWLRVCLVLFAITLAFWTAVTVVDAAVRPLDYFDRFWLYLWFSLLTYAVGVGGLRHRAVRYPSESARIDEEPASAVAFAAAEPDAGRQPDWQAMGARWQAMVASNGWWRDPELTAPRLARHLATNSTYLSRALNEGLGQNFNEFVNQFRVDFVKSELANPRQTREILDLAIEAGFNSKASFNRVFKRMTGETPSEFRARHTL